MDINNTDVLLGEINQCKKLTTVAVIMKDNQLISIGTNNIDAKINECPRKDMPTGVGYELCKTICNQKYHAEVDACLKAGEKAKGATLYLIGHTYCCDNCKKVMDEHGILNVVVCDENKNNSEFQIPFFKGFRIDFIENDLMTEGVGILMLHPNDIPKVK